jgi:hypothetical protein
VKLNLISLIICSVVSNVVLSQIEVPKEVQLPTVKKDKVKVKDSIVKTNELLISYIPHTSSRSLTTNEAPYGKALGVYADETSIVNHDFELSFRAPMKKGLGYKLGMRYATFGEQYKFQLVDSIYTYRTTYKYVALPIGLDYKLKLTSGISWYSSIAFLPQLNLGRKQEVSNTTSKNKETKTTDKSATKVNQATVGFVISTGIRISLARNVHFYAMPEFRINTSNTFISQAPFIHKAKTFGVLFGFGIGI